MTASFRRGSFVTGEEYRQKMPVVLLTGFLGSGKTTLVNALLRDPRLAGTAIAVNEFGDVPLDRHMIEDGTDRTVTLANGCLCCNVSGDMEAAVLRIFARRQAGGAARFSRLIIEPSGLADPAPIAQAILRNPVLSRALRLEAIICTLDAMFAEQQLAHHTEARHQVSLADRIVPTKIDMVEAGTLQRVSDLVKHLNPLAEIFHARHGVVAANALLPGGFIAPDGPVQNAWSSWPAFAADAPPSHTMPTVAASLRADAPLQWDKFDTWLRHVRIGQADHVLRIKGIVQVAGAAGPLAIQGVHHVLHTPVALRSWPDGISGTRIAIVTQGIAPGTLEQAWDDALPAMRATLAASGET